MHPARLFAISSCFRPDEAEVTKNLRKHEFNDDTNPTQNQQE
jgi:hypothetical protein